jgi:hypothetical protein
MASNISKLWMIAPGWKPEIERMTDPPVTLFDFSRDLETRATPIDRFALAVFFKSLGLFRKDPSGMAFQGNGVEAILHEPEPGEGVSAIRLTFGEYPAAAVRSHPIIASLASAFAFRLLDE